VQGVAPRFPDQFQAIERPDSGQDMRGIGAVRAAGFEEVAFF
jgi:hypothetical protein